MKFQRDADFDTYSIQAYRPGEIVVGTPQRVAGETEESVRQVQETLTRSFIIAARHLQVDWPPQQISELTLAHLEPIFSLQPEVFLLGSGARLAWPPPALLGTLAQRGIGTEVMDTAAACRTYNILMLEGRQVAAALLML